MNIIDSHHHIWRQQDLPWLQGTMVPRIFGPYESIRRDYPVEEFLADQAGSGITQSVYVQTNWPPEQFEQEAAWVQAESQRSGWPHAMVAYADMLVPDVRPQLDRLKAYPLVRGVRMQLHWHENPLYRFAPGPEQVRSEVLGRNLEYLADYGYTFDLQVFPRQMRDAAQMASLHPKVSFILVHAGMLADTSPVGVQAWREGMGKLAAQRNVFVKLSGLGTFIQRNDPAHIAMVVGQTVTFFGAQRCMFGSNFPIEKIWTDHASLLQAYRDAVQALPLAEQEAIFSGTAARVYRLSV
jgi:predicted TIM-barrel fold metal-dependent hydrolase